MFEVRDAADKPTQRCATTRRLQGSTGGSIDPPRNKLQQATAGKRLTRALRVAVRKTGLVFHHLFKVKASQ